MKRLVIIVIAIAACTLSYAQNIKTINVITLKDSTIIKGEIIENIINDYVSIKTNTGEVKVIKYPEILKISKEKSEFSLSDYGGDFSVGPAIGGGGIVGAQARYFLTDKIPFEFGIHLRPVYVLDSYSGNDFSMNTLFAGTFDFYLNKNLKRYKNRVQMNGLFLNAGYHTGKEYKGTILGFGWAFERFKLQHKKYSVSFELGAGLDFLTEKVPPEYYNPYYEYEPEPTLNPLIFWKIGWNFFVK